jgi:hypothetical protein
MVMQSKSGLHVTTSKEVELDNLIRAVKKELHLREIELQRHPDLKRATCKFARLMDFYRGAARKARKVIILRRLLADLTLKQMNTERENWNQRIKAA